VNHAAEPLVLKDVEHPRDRFETRIETLDDGQRYRLTVSLLPAGPAGKHSSEITLRTSLADPPSIVIPVHTLLRERVYTFPDAVDLGAVNASEIRSTPRLPTQTLMVYQRGGHDFDIEVQSDVEGLSITRERGPQGDRHQLTLSLDPKHAAEPRRI